MGSRSTTTWERDLLTMASNFCDRVELSYAKGHIKLIMEGPAGRKALFCSGTPSDHRTLANTAKQMKMVAVEIGAYR